MKDEELAAMFETRAAALAAAAETIRDPEGRQELRRIAAAYQEQARTLRARRR